MATRDDPLTTPDLRPDRVFYAVGALLGADDFTAEQDYHRGRLARALAYLAGTGTVAGLRVTAVEPEESDRYREDGERVTVDPGLALDPFGRIVEVTTPVCTRLNRWLRAEPASVRQTGYVTAAAAVAQGLIGGAGALGGAPGAFVVDVFLAFRECERGKTPAFASGPYEALDAVVPSRIRDGWELSLVLRQETPPPVPEGPWPDLSGVAAGAARREALQDAVLDGWREGTEHFDQYGRRRLSEHAQTQDGGEVLLARMIVPAQPAAVEGSTQHVRFDAGVIVDNRIRRFVYPLGALAAAGAAGAPPETSPVPSPDPV